MSSKKKAKFVSKRGMEKILQDSMGNLEIEDYYDDIFERSDNELKDSEKVSYKGQNADIGNIDVNIEASGN